MRGHRVVLIAVSGLLGLIVVATLLAVVAAGAASADLLVQESRGYASADCVVAAESAVETGSGSPSTKTVAQATLPPGLLVDDFSDATPTNTLGGSSGWTGNPPATITCVYTQGMACCDYNVPESTYALYFTDLLSRSLTGYNSLSFRVKGDVEGELVRAELKECVPNYPKLVIEDYTVHPITTTWQWANLPLAGFTEVTDWGCFDKFGLVLANAGGDGRGQVCLDDIWFLPEWAPVLVDDFDDCQDPNAIGGVASKFVTGTATMEHGYTSEVRMGDIGCAHWITYADVNVSSYAVWQTELRGLDVSEYVSLEFYVKGANGGEKPHIWLQDVQGRRGYQDVTVTATTTNKHWQRVVLPLQPFADQKVDLGDLSTLQLGFEWEEMEGTVYLEDIRFVVSSTLHLPLITADYAAFCDGGFEHNWACWQHGGELGQRIVQDEEYVYSGERALLLGDPAYPNVGGVPTGSGRAWQIFTLPVDSTSEVRLVYRIYTHDLVWSENKSRYYDSFEIYVNDVDWAQANDPDPDDPWRKARCRDHLSEADTSRSGLVFCDGNPADPSRPGPPKDLGWRHVSLDLSAFEGQIITLYLANFNRVDGKYNTWTYVDDVAIGK